MRRLILTTPPRVGEPSPSRLHVSAAPGRVMPAITRAARPARGAVIQRDVTLDIDGKEKDRVISSTEMLLRIKNSRDGKKLVSTFGEATVDEAFARAIDGQRFTSFSAMIKALATELKGTATARAASAEDANKYDERAEREAFVRAFEAQLAAQQEVTPGDLSRYLALGEALCTPYWYRVAQRLGELLVPAAATIREATAQVRARRGLPDVPAAAGGLEKRLREARDVTLHQLAQYLDRPGADPFWSEVAARLLDGIRRTRIDGAAIAGATRAVNHSRTGESLRQVTEARTRTLEEIEARHSELVEALPAIALTRLGSAALARLADDSGPPELARLFARIEQALQVLESYWYRLKSGAQEAVLAAIGRITEVGGARGVVGELSALAFVAPRAVDAAGSVNVSKAIERPTRPEFGVQLGTQEVDVTSRREELGREVRVYTEAKYDMDTFLDKASDTGAVEGVELPKQLDSYERTRDRPPRRRDRRLELFVADPHDWLLLFLPQYSRLRDYLLAHGWTVVIAGVQLSPADVRRLGDWARSAAIGGSKAQKQWARDRSVQSPTTVLARIVPGEAYLPLAPVRTSDLGSDFWRALNAAIQATGGDHERLDTIVRLLYRMSPALPLTLRDSYREDFDLALGYEGRVDEAIQALVIRVIDELFAELHANRPGFLE